MKTDLYLNFILESINLSLIQHTNKRNSYKNTYELYITNWSYSYKVGIVFAMYKRMRSKGTSWAGPRHKGTNKRIELYTLTERGVVISNDYVEQ